MRTLGELTDSYVTGVLHTARISTVQVIMISDKSIKMVNFKLGNEWDKEQI